MTKDCCLKCVYAIYVPEVGEERYLICLELGGGMFFGEPPTRRVSFPVVEADYVCDNYCYWYKED